MNKMKLKKLLKSIATAESFVTLGLVALIASSMLMTVEASVLMESAGLEVGWVSEWPATMDTVDLAKVVTANALRLMVLIQHCLSIAAVVYLMEKKSRG